MPFPTRAAGASGMRCALPPSMICLCCRDRRGWQMRQQPFNVWSWLRALLVTACLMLACGGMVESSSRTGELQIALLGVSTSGVESSPNPQKLTIAANNTTSASLSFLVGGETVRFSRANLGTIGAIDGATPTGTRVEGTGERGAAGSAGAGGIAGGWSARQRHHD